MRILAAIAALALPVGACAQTGRSAAPVDPVSPQGAAKGFYRWYLEAIAKGGEAADDPRTYARYVTASLRAEIARRTDSAEGIDADYFIKAQDVFESWKDHVVARGAGQVGAKARVAVTLGIGREAWRLSVAMTRENGTWKIAGVTHP